MHVMLLLLLLFFAMPSSLCFALDNKVCLECHGGRDILKMTAEERSWMVIPDPHKKAPGKGRFSLFLDDKKFTSSVHGRLQCTDCHKDIKDTPHAQRLGTVECDACHPAAVREYTSSDHAGSASCLDCHNPHEAFSYTKLSLDERSAVCLKCHERGGHVWLPERALHFGSLECTVCHAPEAKKTLLLYFSPGKKTPLSYSQIKGVGGNGGDVVKTLDVNGNNSIDLSEIKHFLPLLEKAGLTSPRITAEGLVSEPHHGFTRDAAGVKDCTLCHSGKATFYANVMMKVPSKNGWRIFKADQEIVTKTSLIPARENYFTTVHAKQGVECIECHAYQKVIREGEHFKIKEMKELVCGTKCHKDIMDEYKASLHYKVHEHFCLDCHEPHPNTPYAQLDATQRRAICMKCHKDTERQHKWQSQQSLHCKFVECTMCHSPKAKKGIVFYLRGLDGRGREKRLDSGDLAELGNLKGQDVVQAIDRDHNKVLDEGELTSFLESLNDPKMLQKKGFERVDLGVNLLTLRPFHDFTEKMKKAKDCSLCHSSEAEGLASVVLHLPGPGGNTITAPVKKEALLVFLPPPGVGNFYLLGGKKLSREDLRLLWRDPSFNTVTKLGYKLLESLGFLFLIGAVAFVGLHGSLRVMTRGIRKQRKAGRM